MHINISHLFSKCFLIISFLFIAQLSIAEIALAVPAQTNTSNFFDTNIETHDELSCTLKRIVEVLAGPMGQAIATLAIIALGIGLFMGKLSWGLAVATAMGVAMIFGAPNIVDWLSGGHFYGSIICEPHIRK